MGDERLANVTWDGFDLKSGMVRAGLPLGKPKQTKRGVQRRKGGTSGFASRPVLVVVEGEGSLALHGGHVGPVVAGARQQHVAQ